jgi:topoisomerase-4 subunit B
MRKEPVMVMPETHIQQILEYYMGKNTQERQEFIIDNLKVELDAPLSPEGEKKVSETLVA